MENNVCLLPIQLVEELVKLRNEGYTLQRNGKIDEAKQLWNKAEELERDAFDAVFVN